MAERRTSDFELVKEALDVAYSRTPEIRHNTMSTTSVIKLRALPSLPRDVTRVEHAVTRIPRATWLDHTIPAPSSSSPMSIPGYQSAPYQEDLETHLEKVLDRASIQDEAFETTKSVETNWTSKVIKASATERSSGIDHPHQVYYMSGAIQESPLSTGARSAGNSSLLVTSENRPVRLIHAPIPTQSHLEIPLLKPGSSGMSRFKQDMRVRAESPDIQPSEDTDNEALDGDTVCRRLRFDSPDHTGVLASIEQRRDSVDSGRSVEMEISPEDFFAPQIIYCQSPVPAHTTDSSIQHHVPGSLQQYPTASFDNNIAISQISGENAVEDMSAYSIDHRGYHVRPVQTLSSHEHMIPQGVKKANQNVMPNSLDGDSKLVTPPKYRSILSQSPIRVLKDVTSTDRSPTCAPQTSFIFDKDIRQSVERNPEPNRRVRESTPVYTDRSLTPSPASQVGKHITDTAFDEKMIDSNTHTIHSRSVIDRSLRTSSMLPPPSPVRSLTNSPFGGLCDPASPSMLRSPAIMRVIDQFQVPNWDTLFPMTRCSRSPSPSPNPRPRSGSSLKSSCSTLRYDSKEASRQEVCVSRNVAHTWITDDGQARPLVPAPPPVPDDDAPGLIKQKKRNGRRKSTVQDVAAKVGKLRSVTSGNNVKGKRIATAVKKPRVVTVGLAKALDVDLGQSGLMNSNTYHKTEDAGDEGAWQDGDQMDIDEELNATFSGLEEFDLSNRLNREPQLRRSTRLRTMKP